MLYVHVNSLALFLNMPKGRSGILDTNNFPATLRVGIITGKSYECRLIISVP